MKRIAALLLCVALAATMLIPIHLEVNKPGVNKNFLADDPLPPYPPPPKVV